MSISSVLVLGALFAITILPLAVVDAFAVDYKKHVTSEDLGVLQLAAHDLFNVDRCKGNSECAVEHEDGKLNLSTLFLDTTNPTKPEFPLEVIRLGGEHRNRENIILFTVASALGEKYANLLDEGMSSSDAKTMIVTEYHRKLADSYQKTFGEQFPLRNDSYNSLEDRFQQNLALRTIHDFLPGKIKFEKKWTSTLDSSLFGKKLSEKELKQMSSKLDGRFDEEFLAINICLDPPVCNFPIMVNLLNVDKSFGEQFNTPESFDDLLEELEDGLYNKDDRALFHIRNIMAKGQNF